MDFAHSLRNSRGSSGSTPRGSQTNSSPASSHSRGSPSPGGMSINVTPGSSPSHARSSPRGSNGGGGGGGSAGPRRSSSTSSSTITGSAADYLQRSAISNSYSSRVDDETSSNISESLSILSGGAVGGGGGSGGGVSSPMSVSSRSGSMSGGGERGSNFKVVIRVRPPLPRELHNDRPFQNVIHVDSEGHVLTVSENLSSMATNGGGGGTGGSNGNASGGGNDNNNGGANGGGAENNNDNNALAGSYGSHMFSFDHVYDQHCTQRVVYENTAKAVVESSLEGYNATIFAYGQTGTGKTYTMEGFNSGSGASAVEERGIIPRAIEQIFCHIQSNMSARMRFLVRASYLQIYNESISDLLKPERNNLTIREDKKRGVFVEGLSEWVVRSPEEIYGLMERGGAMRATGSTKMNEISSRSHAVFIIIAEQSKTSYVDGKGHDISAEEFTALVNAYQARHGTAATHTPPGPNGSGATGLHPKLESMVRQSFKVGKLNLVDLAGSERVRLSGATGQRLEESKKINQSLSALGNVIAALTDARGRQHIPYRDSKLTRILEDSLGGNCKTTMMAMISPALEAITESLSTLKFANRAKSIKNEARVNEDLDQKSLLRKYERELKRLRAELDEKSRNVVDKRRLLELDEQRKRAEEDKMAAIRALEERSKEFMREKEEKKKLEQRIAMLMSQVLTSNQRRGGGPGGGPGGAAMGGAATRFMMGGGEGGAEDGGDAVFMAMALSGDGSGTDDPLIREALKEHHERIRQEYACRLADLEKERESIEEEKAQVDRYKQLLLKQRDIMIALTQRLNERDEQITALQDELDAYDRHQKELEEKLDERTAHLIHLERVTMEQSGGGGAGGGGEKMSSSVRDPGVPSKPELLIAHKQYRAYHSLDSGGSSLLSAHEKIQELAQLVDGHVVDNQRIAKELEDVKAEKVSVEYLLRDRLEKLVQVEMDARMKSMAWSHQQQQSDQLSKLHRQLETLEQENKALKGTTHGSKDTVGGGGDQLVLQARCDTLLKERRAVQTIMEHKIKALVTAISDASEATFQSAGGADQLGEPAKWLAKEVHALQRLVNASIVALRNADASATTNQASTRSTNTQATTAGAVVVPQAKAPAATRSVDLTSAPPPQPLLSAPSPAGSTSSIGSSTSNHLSTSGLSVDELIHQRRAQLQRERQSH